MKKYELFDRLDKLFEGQSHEEIKEIIEDLRDNGMLYQYEHERVDKVYLCEACERYSYYHDQKYAEEEETFRDHYHDEECIVHRTVYYRVCPLCGAKTRIGTGEITKTEWI